ncbi:MAG: hypothetical protein VX899_19235 [Myxococcota bacterium]|nr:hypothetical protein [Myxococcota bacterium]
MGAEHIRLGTASSARWLPGLQSSLPSRMKDSVQLALAGGASSVDIVLARIPGVKPWELDNADFISVVDSMLFHQPGAVLVFPDLGGPIPVGPGTDPGIVSRLKRMVVATRKLSAPWAERYQVACIDLPEGPAPELRAAMTRLIGIDAALVRWTGAPHRMEAHAWRSGATLVASALAGSRNEMSLPLVGRRLPLPGGRRTLMATRMAELQLTRTRPEPDPLEEFQVRLAIRRGSDHVSIESEGSFRRPLGEWPLPCLRTVKTIHQRLQQASEQLLFRNADATHAIALQTALQEAMMPFVRNSIIEPGPGGGPPEIQTAADANPIAPNLNAQVTLQLVPWQRDVKVRVSLKPGDSPDVEVS